MSRIGRKPINVPANVTVTIANGLITVKGAKGTLTQDYDDKNISFVNENNVITVKRANDNNDVRAKHGLYRALLENMIEGVTNGFSKTLEINGVGYKAQKTGNKLVMNLGMSHQVEVVEDEGITIDVLTPTSIKISGYDKQKVGQFASKIRDIRPVEPYHAYGIKYTDEVVIRKAGKTAGKGKK